MTKRPADMPHAALANDARMAGGQRGASDAQVARDLGLSKRQVRLARIYCTSDESVLAGFANPPVAEDRKGGPCSRRQVGQPSRRVLKIEGVMHYHATKGWRGGPAPLLPQSLAQAMGAVA